MGRYLEQTEARSELQQRIAAELKAKASARAKQEGDGAELRDAPDGVNDAAEQAVMTFLREVNAAASAKGILPDPIRGTVGVIDGAEFYGLVQELRAYTGAVIISAYADGDTDAMGPLRLKFKVESEHGM